MRQKLKAGLYSLLLLLSCLIILPAWYVREQAHQTEETFDSMANIQLPELAQPGETAQVPPTPPEVQKPISRLPESGTTEEVEDSAEAVQPDPDSLPEQEPEEDSSAEELQPQEDTSPAVEESHTFEGSYVFSTVDESYFADALFIGDSRTVGLSEYGRLSGATYFADVGMSCYSVFQTTVNVPGIGSTDLTSLLHSRSFGKI